MNTNRSWLKNGKPLCDSLLKRASRRWDADAWERYLDWYQRPRKEALIDHVAYDAICESRPETIYGEFGYETNTALQAYCDGLLKTLPWIESKVLRLIFLEGKTELQAAIEVGKSQSGVHVIKKRALFKLRAANPGAAVIAIRIMRGLDSQIEHEDLVVAPEFPNAPIREDRSYSPENWKTELQAVKNAPIREALRELTPNQQRIVYLRFWCDQPFSKIGRQLGVTAHSASEICDVALFKVKSRAVAINQNQMEVSV